MKREIKFFVIFTEWNVFFAITKQKIENHFLIIQDSGVLLKQNF